MKQTVKTAAIWSFGLSLLFTGFGKAQDLPNGVLFENVRIFDGRSSALFEPANVLVRGNKIERIPFGHCLRNCLPSGASTARQL